MLLWLFLTSVNVGAAISPDEVIHAYHLMRLYRTDPDKAWSRVAPGAQICLNGQCQPYVQGCKKFTARATTWDHEVTVQRVGGNFAVVTNYDMMVTDNCTVMIPMANFIQYDDQARIVKENFIVPNERIPEIFRCLMPDMPVPQPTRGITPDQVISAYASMRLNQKGEYPADAWSRVAPGAQLCMNGKCYPYVQCCKMFTARAKAWDHEVTVQRVGGNFAVVTNSDVMVTQNCSVLLPMAMFLQYDDEARIVHEDFVVPDNRLPGVMSCLFPGGMPTTLADTPAGQDLEKESMIVYS